MWVTAIFDSLVECINTNLSIKLMGIGTFTRRHRQPMYSRVRDINIPERWSLRFIPSSRIKKMLCRDDIVSLGLQEDAYKK